MELISLFAEFRRVRLLRTAVASSNGYVSKLPGLPFGFPPANFMHGGGGRESLELQPESPAEPRPCTPPTKTCEKSFALTILRPRLPPASRPARRFWQPVRALGAQQLIRLFSPARPLSLVSFFPATFSSFYLSPPLFLLLAATRAGSGTSCLRLRCHSFSISDLPPRHANGVREEAVPV